jgi:putative ABC transport system ATP-binding protein
MLELISVNKYYKTGDTSIHVLNDISFKISKGDIVVIMGPSGSGKSTLLAISAGLDRADTGEVKLDGISYSSKNEEELSKIRLEKIGFIFQNFKLIQTLTAWENVSLPLVVASNLSEKQINEKSLELLDKVGLSHRKEHYPYQLSGGEAQRVAIARSFINNPVILFADEPTGNLDAKNADIILNLLKELNDSTGSTLVIVTHDPGIKRISNTVLEMNDGKVLIQK